MIEHVKRIEAIALLEDARKKHQILKSAISSELKDRQALATELNKLQQANDLALKGAGSVETVSLLGIVVIYKHHSVCCASLRAFFTTFAA